MTSSMTFDKNTGPPIESLSVVIVCGKQPASQDCLFGSLDSISEVRFR